MEFNIFWQRFLEFFGLKEEGDEYTIPDEDQGKKVVSIHKNQEFKVIIHHPDSYDDVTNIVDDLKSRKPVILNLENVEIEVARRIIDFVSGAIYGLEGNIQKVGEAVFLFTPSNITIDGELIKDNYNKSFVWN